MCNLLYPTTSRHIKERRCQNQTIGVQAAFNWSPGGTDTMWTAKVGTFPADRRPEAYLNATFTQQSPWLAIISFKVHRRDVEDFGYAGVLSVRVDRAALRRCWLSQVSGTSCLLLLHLRCDGHFWLSAGLSHRRVFTRFSRFPCSVSADTSCLKCVRAKRLSASGEKKKKKLHTHAHTHAQATPLLWETRSRWMSTDRKLERAMPPSGTVGNFSVTVDALLR